MNENFYHPTVKMAVEYWCGEISNDTTLEKLEIFRETLLKEISKLFDMPEGFIEIYTKVPDTKAYAVFEKPNEPSRVLRAALKKAKLKRDILPLGVSMTVSTSKIEVLDETLEKQVIWKTSK